MHAIASWQLHCWWCFATYVDFIDTEAIDFNGLVLSDLDILPVLHLLQLGGGDLLLAGLLDLERHHDRLLHHLLHPHLLVPHLGALLRHCVLLIDLLPVGHLTGSC